MKVSKVTALYFSPTGTTKKVIEAIAEGTGLDITISDITLPSAREEELRLEDELLIIGAPCYGGRVPTLETEYLKSRVTLKDTPVVLVVTYGNRDYDDALLELKDTVVALGGKPVAMGVFLGEHSYSYGDVVTAAGRPDTEDLTVAQKFGQDIMAKLESASDLASIADITCKGNRPYKNNVKKLEDKADPPVVDGNCNQCGVCAKVCPAGAIDPSTLLADKVKCILCQACVKNCPSKVRVNKSPGVTKAAHYLAETFPERKNIEIIL